MIVYRPGDCVVDAAGNHFIIEFEGEVVSIGDAQKRGLRIVDRAAYGALDRAARGLAHLHPALPPPVYDAVFDLMIQTIACEPTALARAVMRERKFVPPADDAS